MIPEEEKVINRNTMKLQEHLYKSLKQRDQYKAERDTLIDDLTWYKAKVERFERENDLLLKERDYYNGRYKTVHANEVEARKDKNKFMKQKCLLEHENKRLTRLTHKLTAHRTMWDNLKDWRRGMLEIDKNDTQLIGLGLVMDELEHNWLYREEK